MEYRVPRTCAKRFVGSWLSYLPSINVSYVFIFVELAGLITLTVVQFEGAGTVRDGRFDDIHTYFI